MHRFIGVLCSAMLLVLASAPAYSQTSPRPVEQAPAAGSAATLPPIKIVVTASRYDGDKRLSSLPYTMSVIPASNSSNGFARLRMGTQVPVPSTTTPKEGGAAVTSYIYRDVGTNIDVKVQKADDERYRVEVNFEDSSVYAEPRSGPATPTQIAAPSIRNFSINNQLLLKDGQSAQFNTSPDKVTGEIVKLDISLTVIK